MNKITRRKFLGRTAAASGAIVAPWIISPAVLGANGFVAPSERIAVGLIGRGLMGNGHLHRLLGDANFEVHAVCDVDRTRCEEGQRRVEETYAAARTAGR